jgi:hypothetical protein
VKDNKFCLMDAMNLKHGLHNIETEWQLCMVEIQQARRSDGIIVSEPFLTTFSLNLLGERCLM